LIFDENSKDKNLLLSKVNELLSRKSLRKKEENANLLMKNGIIKKLNEIFENEVNDLNKIEILKIAMEIGLF